MTEPTPTPTPAPPGAVFANLPARLAGAPAIDPTTPATPATDPNEVSR